MIAERFHKMLEALLFYLAIKDKEKPLIRGAF
jgi:hypothetical protein